MLCTRRQDRHWYGLHMCLLGITVEGPSPCHVQDSNPDHLIYNPACYPTGYKPLSSQIQCSHWLKISQTHKRQSTWCCTLSLFCLFRWPENCRLWPGHNFPLPGEVAPSGETLWLGSLPGSGGGEQQALQGGTCRYMVLRHRLGGHARWRYVTKQHFCCHAEQSIVTSACLCHHVRQSFVINACLCHHARQSFIISHARQSFVISACLCNHARQSFVNNACLCHHARQSFVISHARQSFVINACLCHHARQSFVNNAGLCHHARQSFAISHARQSFVINAGLCHHTRQSFSISHARQSFVISACLCHHARQSRP